MLWMGATGSTIQLIDLETIAADAPPTDPTQLSIVEGMYGPGNYTVIQLGDFSAPAFPAGFDFGAAVATVLRAARAGQGADGAPPGPATWMDLRIVNGMPVGQVMQGNTLVAFNAANGVAVAAIPPQQFPQGARLPPSLRQKLKILHRFWNRGDVPGVYFELLTGLVLFTLLVTGLVMYFRLLAARAKTGRRQWFWLTGGTWRGLHRAVSVVAAAFLLCMAFSGTWIGYESSYSALNRGAGAGGRRAAPALSDDDMHAMTAATLRSMERLHPGTPIKAIRLRTFGSMKQGVVISGGARTDQLVFDTTEGRPASLTEPAYPPSNFPFGVQVHENIKHFHSGAMFGIPTRLMNLFAGLSLVFLSVSGLVVYLQMWIRRRAAGRSALVWK